MDEVKIYMYMCINLYQTTVMTKLVLKDVILRESRKKKPNKEKIKKLSNRLNECNETINTLNKILFT